MTTGDIPTVGSVCPECNLMHPIIPGKKCLMAKEKTPEGTEIDFDSFFGSLKTIVVSQIETKNIKDPKKFLGHVVVNITKLIEGYSE